MPQYKIGESVFDIEDSRVDEFLNVAKANNDTPELIDDTAIVDPGKKKTPKKDGATAESAKTAPDMDSYSGIGSLEYGKEDKVEPNKNKEEDIFDPYIVSIDNVSYTKPEIEAQAIAEGLTYESYLSKFPSSRLEILRDEEKLDEVIVYGEDKYGLIKTYNSIQKKALIASVDPQTLKDARAKIYFGDLLPTAADYANTPGTATTSTLPTSDFAKKQILRERLGDKYPLYEQYLETGNFTLPSFKEDEGLTFAAQQEIKGNIFENELSGFPEGMQEDLKIIANEDLEFKNPKQLDLYVSKTAAEIEQRNAFVKQSTASLINSDKYKALKSSLEDIDSRISMRLRQFKDKNANEETVKLLNNLIQERTQILNNNSDLLSDIDRLNVLEQRNFRDLGKLKSKISRSSREISNVNLFSNKADLNYNPGARVLNSFSQTFVNGALGTLELGLDILTLPLNDDEKTIIKPVKETLIKLQQGLAAEQIPVPEARTALDKVLDNSGSVALSLFGAGTTAVISKGGSAAEAAKLAQKVTLGGFFVTSAGNDYSQSRIAQENAPLIITSLENKIASGNLSNKEKESTYKEIALQKEIMNYPTIAMAGASLFKGASEVVFENLQLNMLGTSVAKNLYGASLKDLTKLIPAYLKVGGLGVITNNTQELFTTVSNNLIDNTKEFFSIQPKYKSLLDGVNKDFFITNTLTGAITSGIVSAPHLVNRLANVGKMERDKSFFLGLANEYNKLEEKLLSTTDADARVDIQAKQKTIMDRAALYNASLASKLEDLTPTQLDKLFGLHAAEESIHNQIFTLVSNANMSEDGNKFADEQTQEKFDELNKELSNIANKKLEALNSNYNYRAEYEKKLSAEQLFLKYQDDLGDRIAQLKAGKDNVLILNFDTRPTRQQIKEAVDDFDPSFKNQESYEETINKLYAGIQDVGSSPGVDLGNGKYISNKWLRESIILGENGQDKTLAAFISVTMFHELLHGFSRSKDSKIDTGLLNKAIEEIKQNLYNNSVSGSISKENYQIVLNRIQENTNGYANDSSRLYEETMQVYEEAVRLGYIKRSDLENNSFGLIDLIGSLRKAAFGGLGIGAKVYESNADDISAHLKSFNQFISTSKQLAPPTNEEVAEALLSQSNSVYNKKIEELEEKLLSGEIDYDKYDEAISALDAEIEKAKKVAPKEEKVKVKSTKITEAQQKLNDKIDNLVGKKDENNKYTITKEQWDKGGIKKAYDEIIIGSAIDPLITRGMIGDTIYGKPIEQFIEDVKNGLADVLIRFNPEDNNSLIGFINSQLRFRKLDVLNKYKKELGTSSIDIEAGEVGAVQELMSDEDAEFEIFKSEELAKEKEEKVKPNLSDNVRLSEAVSNKLSDNMVKAIALNIKKFDEEISKNRTITPFVADFKKDISNLMEQDMISYIRSYGYEQFLKDTREVYLLNLPTSVLSKHPVFRAGVEKRVNGKWVSPIKVGKEKYDWVDENGKKLKIDRDNAIEGRGLTSGPEMIRRNANIVNVVTENMYVDYHFMDGANRRVSKQNPLSSIARQMASEIAIEKVQQDLRVDGPLTKEIAQRAEVVGLLLSEEEIKALDKNFERGLAKLSQTAYIAAVELESLALVKAKESLIDPISKYFTELYTNIDEYYGNNYKINEVFNANFNGLINPKTEEEIKAVNKFKNALRRKANESMVKITADVLANKIADTSILAKGYGDALTTLVKNDTLKATLELEKYGVGDVVYKNYVTTVFNLTYSFYKKTDSLKDKVEALATAWDLLAPTITKGNKTAEEIESGQKSKKKLKNNYYENVNDFFQNHLQKFAKSEGIELTLSSNGLQVLYDGENLKSLSSVNVGFKFIPQTAKGRGIDLSKIDSGVFMQTIDPGSVVTNLAERNAQADEYASKFIELISYFADRVKNASKENKKAALWQLYALIELSKTDMKGMLKVAFPLKYVILNKGTYKNESFVYEHTTPAAELALDIANLAKNFINDKNYSIDKLKEELAELFKNQSVSLTQKSIDDALTKAGLKSSLNKLEDNKRYLTDIIVKLFPDAVIIDLSGDILEKEGGKKYSLQEVKRRGVNLSQFSGLDEKSTNTYFNEMIERKKGIAASESISGVTARLEGRSKGKFEIFVPPSAEDFEGMLYYFMGSGEQGNLDRLFFEDKLLMPIAEANYQLNYERQLLKKKYALLLKSNKGILKKLRQESNYKFYTIDSAVRVYIWDKLRFDIPGLYDKDVIELIKIVEADPALKKFADQMVRFPRKQESWQIPKENWAASTLEYDLQQTLDKVGRKRIFAKFIENKKIIFSEANLNKIEAAYGSNFRSALEDMLYRIENGKAREFGMDGVANAYMNWIRGSVAVTMFLNTRSALLQQLSMVNFTNWEENNPLAQAKAFADTKQWASDWAMLWNSDWMKERREGLKTDINESELVTALESSRDKTKALLHWMLTQGFSLTKYGDNFAIATGGAAYYRNRVNMYLKQGLDQAQAEKRAFLDFQEIAERTQQSSRQDLLSNQQVSVAGRLFLSFQNTPMQMTRLTKKAVLDLVNNRGSKKANISKILYYSTIQNMIFSFFQNALFAITGLDDEEDEKLIDSKTERAINNVLDSILRGSGIAGGTIATIKNVLIQIKKQEDAGWKGDGAYILLEAANIAPPVGIKARRFYGAYKNYKINKNIIDRVPYSNLNHPLYGIAGSLSGAAFNVPLDRLISKANNIVEASNAEHEAWQRVALFLGYTPYDLGIKDDELAKIRADVKEEKKKSNKKIGNGKSFRANPVRVKPKRVN